MKPLKLLKKYWRSECNFTEVTKQEIAKMIRLKPKLIVKPLFRKMK